MNSSKKSGNLISIIAAILAFIAESAILFLFLYLDIHVVFFLVLHLIVLLFLLLLVRFIFQRGEDLNYPLLLLVAVFGTGPFGAAGFLVFAALRPIYSYFSTPASVWFEGLFPEHQQSQFSTIYQRITSGWDDYSQLSEISSFQDLFNYGTLSQKQTVLDAIVKDFDPIYAPILKRALDDPHNTVRIQAAAIVAKIDLDFDEQLKKNMRAYSETPDDPDVILKLAQHYDSFTSSGIMDAMREKEIGERAIYYYREYLKINPDDRNIWFTVGRLIFHDKNYSGYLSWFKEYRTKFGEPARIAQTWYQESLYRLHKYEELSTAVRGY